MNKGLIIFYTKEFGWYIVILTTKISKKQRLNIKEFVFWILTRESNFLSALNSRERVNSDPNLIQTNRGMQNFRILHPFELVNHYILDTYFSGFHPRIKKGFKF